MTHLERIPLAIELAAGRGDEDATDDAAPAERMARRVERTYAVAAWPRGGASM